MKLFELTHNINKILVEGGSAIPGMSPINQENVEATLSDLYSKILPALKITQADVASLGSTGKKKAGESSGDIDIAVSIPAIAHAHGIQPDDEDAIYDIIYKAALAVEPQSKLFRGLSVIAMAWPIANINGMQENERVQVDLMPSQSTKWAAWSFYSPSQEDNSAYKGIYRNQLLFSVAKFMNWEVTTRALDKEGIEVDAEWKRDILDLGKGLFRATQSRQGKKGLVKGVKTIDRQLSSLDPDEVVQMMFGPNVKANNILTWEQAFNAVNDPNFINKQNKDKILKMTANGIKNALIGKGIELPLPPELEAAL